MAIISPFSIVDLYELQKQNQQKMIDNGSYEDFRWTNEKQIPFDDVGLFSYQIQQLMSELGEVLQADKRWKNFRNNNLDVDNKLVEISDCFIVLLNIAMFSGISAEQLGCAVYNKIKEVNKRIE